MAMINLGQLLVGEIHSNTSTRSANFNSLLVFVPRFQ